MKKRFLLCLSLVIVIIFFLPDNINHLVAFN
ncbi:MAG: OapA N-terminal domain-containing protein [Paludibacteraceae bacterium]